MGDPSPASASGNVFFAQITKLITAESTVRVMGECDRRISLDNTCLLPYKQIGLLLILTPICPLARIVWIK